MNFISFEALTVVLQLGSTPHWSNICAHSNAPSLAAAWSTLGPPDEEAKLDGLAPCFNRRWHMDALLALAARCKQVWPPSPVLASTSLPKSTMNDTTHALVTASKPNQRETQVMIKATNEVTEPDQILLTGIISRTINRNH